MASSAGSGRTSSTDPVFDADKSRRLHQERRLFYSAGAVLATLNTLIPMRREGDSIPGTINDKAGLVIEIFGG
jgi:hypothetical protein